MPDIDLAGTARLTWDYRSTSPTIRRLYDQASAPPWSANDLDWSRDVDPGAEPPAALGRELRSDRLPFGHDEQRRNQVLWHVQAWMLSQLLHGEQGALLVAARLVEQLPELDHKLCAAAQTLDEARHVEVLSRYLDQKVQISYSPSHDLESVLIDIVGQSDWDLIFLAMQVIVEGVALGTFGASRFMLTEPLAQDMIGRILRDEARHVAFGMTALHDTIAELSSRELAVRYDLVKTTLAAMRTRFTLDEVYERFALDSDDVAGGASFVAAYRKRCLSRVPPLLQRLGIWDDQIASLLDREPSVGAA